MAPTRWRRPQHRVANPRNRPEVTTQHEAQPTAAPNDRPDGEQEKAAHDPSARASHALPNTSEGRRRPHFSPRHCRAALTQTSQIDSVDCDLGVDAELRS